MCKRSIAVLCGAVLAIGAVVLARGDDTARQLASLETLEGYIGGDNQCNIKCKNPNSCPGGARFNCITIGCRGPGACPNANGVDHLPSKFCPACDKAAKGKLDCNGSNTFFCNLQVTCGNCAFSGGIGGAWFCTTTASVGIGNPVVDKSPSGGAC